MTSSSMSKPKRITATDGPKHSLALKILVAKKVIEEHRRQADLAREMNLLTTNIYKWVMQARRNELQGYTVPAFDLTTGDVVAENARLVKELRRVTQERDFLKRAAVFFATATP